MKLVCFLFSISRRLVLFFYHTAFYLDAQTRRGGGTPSNSLYEEGPPERGTFFRLQVYDRVEILLFEVYGRVGRSVIWVCERALKGRTDEFYSCITSGKRSIFVIDSYLNDNAFPAVKMNAKF